MLVLYTSEEERQRLGATPRKVLEVVGVRDWIEPSSPGASPTNRGKSDRDPRTFEVVYLGGTKEGSSTSSQSSVYKCRADSKEARQMWVDALRHALDEPDRIARDEIEEAQQDLGHESEVHEKAMKDASDAVEEATRLGQRQLECEAQIQQIDQELAGLQVRVDQAQVLMDEVVERRKTTQEALEHVQDVAHDIAIEGRRGSEIGEVDPDSHDERIARLTAQLEVDTAAEDSHKMSLTELQEAISGLLAQRQELSGEFHKCGEDGKRLRQAAGQRLEEAQVASRRRKMRITSWSVGDTMRSENAGWTAPMSQLDPLVEGYLQCKHPTRSTMHRRYYVLVGNTLCWYPDVDTYIAKMDCPSGAVHVSGVVDWDGRCGSSGGRFAMNIGGILSPRKSKDSDKKKAAHAHAFGISTIEGTTLLCSAPTKDSVANWTAALHISLTMPPLSPHRAVAAKARRDSFDLLASMSLSPSSSSGSLLSSYLPPMQRRHSSVDSRATTSVQGVKNGENEDGSGQMPQPDAHDQKQSTNAAITEVEVHVEGYLVQRNAATSSIMMKKKYCVLRGLEFGVFESFDAYRAAITVAESEEQQLQQWAATKELFHVCGVREWDGHARLLQYHHAFQLQALAIGSSLKQQQQTTIFCSATNATEKTRWLSGVREALLKYRDTVLSPTRRQESMVERARRSILRIATDSPGDATSASEGYTDETSKNAAASIPVDDYSLALQEFHEMMEKYYAEHHPSKLHDVPMLTEKYRDREQALVDHLDRIHGTSITSEPRMISVLQRLTRHQPSLSPQTSSSQPQLTQSKRSSTGVRTGLIDFVSMSGYLSWCDNSEFVSSFCVLSINKLVRYRSQTHHETESHAPMSSYLISSVYEFPPPPSFRALSPRASGATKHIFFLAASIAVQTSSKTQPGVLNEEATSIGSTQVDIVLAAPTGEDKLRWMAKIRSGLGFAHAHADNSSAVGSASSSDSARVKDGDTTSKLRRKLVEYYIQHNPRRVGEVDSLLAYFAGRERQLLVSLDSTYGTNIQHDDSYISLLPAGSSPTNKATTASVLLNGIKSTLSVKHPTLGPDFSRRFCSLQGTKLVCYLNEEGDGASTSPSPTLSAAVVAINTLNPKLAEMLVFSVETREHGVVLLRADSEDVMDDWTQALKTGIDASRREQIQQEMDALPDDEPLRQLFGILAKFYRSHNPDKECEVGTLLRAYRGRELRLLHEIDAIYHSRLALDPNNIRICDAAGSNSGITTSTSGDTSDVEIGGDQGKIAMEGYLTKRGHLMPSMRKRYCMLADGRLLYYVTKEDSRDPKRSTKPQGSFVVTSVADWNGQTSTREYDHGIELEASDGRTFFCAAPSADEKAQWVQALQQSIATAQQSSSEGPESTAKREDGKEHSRRSQLREHLAQFYRERNPKKLSDLDLLMTYYAGREMALLEAIDEAYNSTLAQNEELLTLISPSAKQSEALLTLKYDGYLKQAADISWLSSQNVYVSVDGLAITFFTTREAFKSGMSPPSQAEVTLVAVKGLDGAGRFAIETTEHTWIYFEASHAAEKREWILVLQAALDSVLAQNILSEEQEAMRDRGSSSSRVADVSARGNLLIRMDLDSLENQVNMTTESTAMQACYCLLQNTNELHIRVIDDGDRSWRFTIRSTKAWHPSPNSSPVTLSKPCRFPFQITTDQQFVISCGAASDVERAKWIHQVRLGAEQASALEMLEEQLLEVKEELKSKPQTAPQLASRTTMARSSSVYIPSQAQSQVEDVDDGVTKGSVAFQLAGMHDNTPNPTDAASLYIILTERGEISVYESERAVSDRPPVYKGQVLDFAIPTNSFPTGNSPQRHLLKLFGRDSSSALPAPSVPPLSVIVRDTLSGPAAARTSHLFPSSDQERDMWLTALNSCIGIQKGETLLADEKIILTLEQEEKPADKPTTDSIGDSVEQNVVNAEVDEGKPTLSKFTGAAMEGILNPWNPSSSGKGGKAKTPDPLFFVLVGCRLMGFVSQEDAVGEESDASKPVIDVEATNVTDWEAPRSVSGIDKGYPLESLGFRIDASIASETTGAAEMCFIAPSIQAKRDWVRFIRQEVEFALAERYLDEDAKTFARLVAQDLNAKAHAQTYNVPQIEGYVRVRHHFLGAAWREHYLVLRGSRLVVYKTARDAGCDELSKKTIESHEVVSAAKWTPVAGGGSSCGGDRRYGFRIANEVGGYLECTVSSEAEARKWIDAIASASSVDKATLGTSKWLNRDVALPFISGAAMEGYLLLKDRVKRSRFAPLSTLSTRSWKSRYCVLMGTHLLLYDNQKEAISSDMSTDTDDIKPPLAVYEVTSVIVFESGKITASERASEADTTTSEVEVESDAVKFTFRVSTGGELRAKAQSTLERKRWINAVEDTLDQAAACIDEIVRVARTQQERAAAQEQVKSKLLQVQTDALRQSILLKEALQFAATEIDATSDESDSDKYYESDNGELENNPLRQRSKSDYLDRSPESSPMRRKQAFGAHPFSFPQTDSRQDDTNKIKSDNPEPWTISASFSSFFKCFFRCFPPPETPKNYAKLATSKRSIAPMGVPGFPSAAALANPLYECDYYKDDGYNPDATRW